MEYSINEAVNEFIDAGNMEPWERISIGMNWSLIVAILLAVAALVFVLRNRFGSSGDGSKAPIIIASLFSIVFVVIGLFLGMFAIEEREDEIQAELATSVAGNIQENYHVEKVELRDPESEILLNEQSVIERIEYTVWIDADDEPQNITFTEHPYYDMVAPIQPDVDTLTVRDGSPLSDAENNSQV